MSRALPTELLGYPTPFLIMDFEESSFTHPEIWCFFFIGIYHISYHQVNANFRFHHRFSNDQKPSITLHIKVVTTLLLRTPFWQVLLRFFHFTPAAFSSCTSSTHSRHVCLYRKINTNYVFICYTRLSLSWVIEIKAMQPEQ